MVRGDDGKQGEGTPTMNTSLILSMLLLAIAPVFSLQAQTGGQVDGVTVKNQKVYSMSGDNLEILADNLKLPFAVEVNTNGWFKVGKGNERRLAEGQIIRSDGWLLNPDGSVEPVFDHVVMQAGAVKIVRDGQAAPLAQPMDFANGMHLDPDGSCVYPGGMSVRLMDGQLFRMDGTPVDAKDTATLKNGVVVVQKDGSLIRLAPVQIMGMNDGTRVRGDGQVQKPDGTTSQLREGQTILIEGALLSR
jgi:hypothetical protein